MGKFKNSKMKTRTIYIVVEGPTDKAVLSELLNLSMYNKVSWIVVRSKNNIASYVRTLRLMVEPETKILVVFDADVTNLEKAEESVYTMRQMSRAENDLRNIGFFAFVSDLETNLNIPRTIRKSEGDYQKYAKEHKHEMRGIEIITKIQAFIGNE